MSFQEVGQNSLSSIPLDALISSGDKGMLQVQMEHKFKTVDVLEKHKIHWQWKHKWTFPSITWYRCPLWGPPWRSMCSKWNMRSKWVIEKAIRSFIFLLLTRRVRRNMLKTTLRSGMSIGGLWLLLLKQP